MGDWPNLSVVIITYDRCEILLSTIRHLVEHLYYVGEKKIFVADDGSTDGTQKRLEEFPQVQLVQSNRARMGGNANAGLKEAFNFSPFVLQLQDDLELKVTLDVHPLVEKLRDDETTGYIRLWGVGGHRYTADLDGNFWKVRWESDELYIPSDRPHLKHKRFHDHFGFYPPGLTTSETENAWCFQCKDRARQPGPHPLVLVPLMIDTERSWEHIGWHTRWRDKGL